MSFIMFVKEYVILNVCFKSRDISIHAKGPVILEHPLNMTVVRNEPVTLTCKASGPNPLSYECASHITPWWLTLLLKAVHNKKEQDGGVYWCVVTNGLGSARSKNATLDIAYIRDEFRALPRDTDASVGEEILLKCSPPKGHPSPVIRWKKDGSFIDLTSSNRIRIDDSGSLVVQNVRKRDNGRYQCSAKNIAGTRDSRPVRLKVHEPPYFISRPLDTTALAGDDVLLNCQANGDPYPDVQWHRQGTDIDINKVKIVNGKGLKLENVHPSDEGVYICEANNIRGSISTTAKLSIMEIPVITVKPPASLKKSNKLDKISLDCFVTGTPHPLVFWTIESANSDGKEVLLFSDSLGGDKRISVLRDGSLIIKDPQVKDTGHYVCSSLNSVGSALSRSYLTVYDPSSSSIEKEKGNSTLNLPREIIKLEEARLVLLEETFSDITAVSESPTSIKLEWKLASTISSINGIRLHYRKNGNKSFVSKVIPLDRDTSYLLQDLEEFTEYEIFIRPYYESVSGRPSRLVQIITLPTVPDQAPKILKIKILNATAIFIAWDYVDREHHNGNIKGYQIHIQGNNSEILNSALPSERLESILNVPKLLTIDKANVSIALINHVGVGPFSDSEEILLPSLSEFDMAVYHHRGSGESYAWLLALIGSFTFMLAFASGLTLYYRRRRVLHKSMCMSIVVEAVWWDPLLPHHHKWGIMVITWGNNLFGLIGDGMGCSNYESPSFLQSPYATTDILRAAQQGKAGHHLGPRLFPLSVTPMLHPRNNFLHRSSTATSSCLFNNHKNHYYASKIMSRDARSCDDITERISSGGGSTYARSHHVYPSRLLNESNCNPHNSSLLSQQHYSELSTPPPRVQLYDPYPPRFSRIYPSSIANGVGLESNKPPPLISNNSSSLCQPSLPLGNELHPEEDTEEAITRFDDAVESYMSQAVLESDTDSYLSHGGGESLSEGSQFSDDVVRKDLDKEKLDHDDDNTALQHS
ncbi:immunoglobulin superfamily DCC subclass member 4-like [Lepeophtheirus salmonis]|uniref:immunoglobulin superfamily DCC subclass member 4-like n=1 Tax=Lepeophtheirus salmonis TaxID=72036 RepID=UPI001AE4D67F|nr:immunoglobulin superfamily DCC subclass member 4-like [Lepeophtheirus salmonis]